MFERVSGDFTFVLCVFKGLQERLRDFQEISCGRIGLPVSCRCIPCSGRKDSGCFRGFEERFRVFWGSMAFQGRFKCFRGFQRPPIEFSSLSFEKNQ